MLTGSPPQPQLDPTLLRQALGRGIPANGRPVRCRDLFFAQPKDGGLKTAPWPAHGAEGGWLTVPVLPQGEHADGEQSRAFVLPACRCIRGAALPGKAKFTMGRGHPYVAGYDLSRRCSCP